MARFETLRVAVRYPQIMFASTPSGTEETKVLVNGEPVSTDTSETPTHYLAGFLNKNLRLRQIVLNVQESLHQGTYYFDVLVENAH